MPVEIHTCLPDSANENTGLPVNGILLQAENNGDMHPGHGNMELSIWCPGASMGREVVVPGMGFHLPVLVPTLLSDLGKILCPLWASDFHL